MTDVFSAEKRSSVMRQVKGRNTTPELTVRRALTKLGARFRLHRKDLPGAPDIVLPGRKLAIFVHGCFWHGHLHCPVTKSRDKPRVPVRQSTFWATKLADNRRRDRRKADQLRSSGFRVMTIWGCQLRDPDRVRRRLMTFLDADRQSPRR